MKETVTKYLPDDWAPEVKKEFLDYLAREDKKKHTPSKCNCYNCGHGDIYGCCKIGSGDCVNKVFNKETPTWWLPLKEGV